MSFEESARAFVSELNSFAVPALGEAATFAVTFSDEDGDAFVGCGTLRQSAHPFEPIPMVGQGVDAANAHLGLRAWFRLEPNGRDATTVAATIALMIRPSGSGFRPVFRVDLDKKNTRFKRHEAHVHFHADSSELGYAYGLAGGRMPSFDSLHFPLGGRHFRPTLEDVLFFIDSEAIFSDWHDASWKRAAEASLDRFTEQQVEATVHRHPESAGRALRSLGWTADPAE